MCDIKAGCGQIALTQRRLCNGLNSTLRIGGSGVAPLFVQVNNRFMNGERRVGEQSRTNDGFHQRADVRRLTDAARAREQRVAQMILESERQDRLGTELRGAAGFR